tara:strand:+ start:288 stop:389 length:102 start_codon:yes stop_codon:yes gene_type:complete
MKQAGDFSHGLQAVPFGLNLSSCFAPACFAKTI